jgi:nucleoid-associated protein YgaU
VPDSPPHEKLRLVCSNPKVDIEVSLGDGPATPTAGYAGWEDVSRVNRRAMTSFQGLPALQQDVPIMLDGYREGRSVERPLEEVLSLGGNSIFTAIGPMIFESGKRFVFGDEPEFGEMIRNVSGALLRVRLVLKLKQYVPADEVGRRHKAKPELNDAVPLTYTTPGGESLWAIVAKFYGVFEASANWKRIGKLNGITDPYRVLPKGRVIKLK